MSDMDFGDVTNVVPLRRPAVEEMTVDSFTRANLLRAKEDLKQACRLRARAEDTAPADAELMARVSRHEDEAFLMLLGTVIDYLRVEFEKKEGV
jgi:hypothetical protein